MKKNLCWLIVFFFMSGCASATVLRQGGIVNPNVQGARIYYDYEDNFDNVWKAVVKTCSELDVSIKVIEKDSGIITAERQLVATENLRETFHTGFIQLDYDVKQPSGVYGMANEAMVAERGKVVDSKIEKLDLLKEFAKNNIQVVFSYNIFVEKLESNKTKIKVSIFAYPLAKEMRYYTAQFDARDASIKKQYVDINISSAKFISKGEFEQNFLTLVFKNLK